MKKIPTVLVRNPSDRAHVLDEVTPGCEWVIAGEGRATRKYDGTCVMFDGDHWWARREVKLGKAPLPNYRAEEHDGVTGKTVGWEPIEQSPFGAMHAEALGREAARTRTARREPGTYELCGPKINGNPEKAEWHFIVRHAAAPYEEHWPFWVEGLRQFVLRQAEDGWEGVVWHHPDGRMAKLKARDLR